MEGTWKPVVAGVLNLLSGVTHLCGAIVVLVFGWLGDGVFSILWYGMVGTPFHPLAQPVPQELQRIVAIPVIILSMLAIVGGISSLRRKAWGLAFTGSICAMLMTWFLGIPAIILTVLSRKKSNTYS
jgi:hypothetical protein